MLKKYNKGMKCGLLIILLAFLLMLLLCLMDRPVFDLIVWLFYLGIAITIVSSMNEKRTKFLEKVEKEDNGYVDKGFELLYYKLSYRRRFIRTLWLIPWIILILFWFYWLDTPAYILVPMAVGFAVVEYIQAFVNYKKWKEEKNN